jgi:hypothetical protein
MVGMHHCGGEVKAVAFLDKADGCQHQNLPPCHRKLMEGCCKDDAVVHEGQGFNATNDAISFSAPAPIIADLPPVLISEIIPPFEHYVAFVDYDIPIKDVPLHIFHHLLLI